MSLLQRARESGKCPPSLLFEQQPVDADSFDADLLKVMDGKEFHLSDNVQIAGEFKSLLQRVDSLIKVPGLLDDVKKKLLQHRRSILLAVVGSTPTTSPSLQKILAEGYLLTVKGWLDQVLSGSVGGVDFLLHLLSNVIDLPVTKSVVKGSGMGKAIGSIDKHSICAGTPNESAILDRVQRIKDAWNNSVKARKNQDSPVDSKATVKRELESPSSSSPSSKRAKVVEENKKGSSLSSLIKKVSGTNGGESKAAQAAAAAAAAASANGKSSQGGNSSVTGQVAAAVKKSDDEKPKSGTKKRVKWADHFGGAIAVSEIVEGETAVEKDTAVEASVSWSDRKKRDREREKELLQKLKKSKLMDDDDEEFDFPKSFQPTVSWRTPPKLPERTDVTKTQVTSVEVSNQNERMKSIPAVRYSSEYDIPNSPSPLTDVEQALDMTSQSSAIVAPIPFFGPQQPVVASIPAFTSTYPETNAVAPATSMNASVLPAPTGAAAPEFVQALGLPMFLVGQDSQALQTLASSPSLLSTLVDANGMYDQPKLMSLVQTLSASQGRSASMQQQQPQPIPPQYGATPALGIYGPASTAAPFGQPPPQMMETTQKKNGYRGSNSEANLHVSGFGPSTTQADIITLFSPYVQVDEVVLKGTFAFVNTSDPVNAQRAREALNGTLLCGMPVRINAAQRKNRDPQSLPMGRQGPAPHFGAHVTGPPPPPATSFPGPSYGGGGGMAPGPFASLPPPPPPPPPPPRNNQGMPFLVGPGGGGPGPTIGPHGLPVMPHVDAARDDRGNPATKNLFVAGYGPGTTEQELRELFALHANVIGVVLKGTFTFVNTSAREEAVRCREMLSGMLIHGGPLRINYAKETGRLGTSFDLTYNARSGPNAHRTGAGPGQGPGPGPNSMPPQKLSYYGRGF